MFDWLKDLGIIGFWFFFIKGMIWLLLFALVAFGVVDKAKLEKFKNRFRFFNRRGK